MGFDLVPEEREGVDEEDEDEEVRSLTLLSGRQSDSCFASQPAI